MVEIRHPDGSIETLSYEDFEDAVRRGVVPRHAQVRFPPATGTEFVSADSMEIFQDLIDDQQGRFMARFTFRQPAWVTLATVSLLLVVYAWQLATGDSLSGAVLVEQGAKSLPHQVELGQWWRLLTASLLHAGWSHIIPNLLYVLYVGWNVESLLGRTGTLLVIVASAIGSMIVSSVATPLPTVGASGITFGLFGAALALGWRYGTWMPETARKRFGWSIFPFIVYFLLFGAIWSDFVDNFCHLGGLAVGATLGLTLPSSHVETIDMTARRLTRAGASVALVFITTVGLPAASELGLIGTVLPAADPAPFPQAGYAIHPPRTWDVAEADGAPSWRSLTGAARVTTTAWMEEHEPASRPEVEAVWVAELERSGAIVLPRRMALAPRLPADLGRCFTLEMDLGVEGQPLRALNLGCVRGVHVTTLQFVHPLEHWRTYGPVRQAIIESLDLFDTTSLTRARERAPAEASSDPASALVLASELARLGQRDQAELLLAELEVLEPDAPELLYWRLWTELHLGEGRALASDREQMAERLLLLEPDSLPHVALAFDVFLHRAELGRAREVLDHMRSRWPDRSPTLDRIARMAAAGG